MIRRTNNIPQDESGKKDDAEHEKIKTPIWQVQKDRLYLENGYHVQPGTNMARDKF